MSDHKQTRQGDQGATVVREHRGTDEQTPATGDPPAERERPPPTDEEEGAAGDEPVEPLPRDVQFDILKNSRRRLVLAYLFEAGGETSLGTLSEHVASVENDKDVSLLDSQERKRAYVGLYQCHLPRMDDADVVEFNKSRGLVSLGRHAPELEEYLADDTAADADGRWSTVYLLVSLFGLGASLVAASGVLGPVTLAPAVAVVTLLAVAVVAAVHHRRDAAAAADG